jgi:hypothetical protein
MKEGVGVWSCLCLAFMACAGPQAGRRMPPAAAVESPRQSAVTGGTEVAAPALLSAPGDRAHRELVAAVACWFGGLWSDAEAARNEDREAAATLRCRELVRRLYDREDSDRVEQLRSLEASAVSELSDKLVALAKHDQVDARRQESLVKLLNGSAAAARETMYTRRASDRVKSDIAREQSESKHAGDESAALGPLAKDEALASLWQLEVDDLTHEARAVAILYALDRMNVARGLPKRLKVAALQEPFALLFGAAPSVADTSRPLEGGVWLAYLMSVAKAAGHPVSEKAASLPQRERLAWGGAVMGLADKLQLEAVQLSDATELKAVAIAIARRVRAEYQASEDATLKTPSAEPPSEDKGWP